MMVAKRKPTKKPTKKSQQKPRGKLMSMRVSDGFRAFVLDQLTGVRDFRAKSMFGGLGLYSGEVFFGMVAADVLYFKTDETNRAAYEQAGARPFKPYPDRAMVMPYYSVPVATLDDQASLVAWAQQSIAIAKAGKTRKTSKTQAP